MSHRVLLYERGHRDLPGWIRVEKIDRIRLANAKCNAHISTTYTTRKKKNSQKAILRHLIKTICIATTYITNPKGDLTKPSEVDYIHYWSNVSQTLEMYQRPYSRKKLKLKLRLNSECFLSCYGKTLKVELRTKLNSNGILKKFELIFLLKSCSNLSHSIL